MRDLSGTLLVLGCLALGMLGRPAGWEVPALWLCGVVGLLTIVLGWQE